MITTAALNRAIDALQATGLTHDTLDEYPLPIRAEAGRSVLQHMRDHSQRYEAITLLVKAADSMRGSVDGDDALDRLVDRDAAFMDDLNLEVTYLFESDINDALYHRRQELDQDKATALACATEGLRAAIILGHLNTIARHGQGDDL